MKRIFTEEARFDNQNFNKNPLNTGDYENCTFINCNFSDNDLSDINFSDCEFIGCNLSLVKLVQTSFKDVKFKNSKLLGLHFSDCNDLLFTVDFENCVLNLSSFYKLKLRKTRFKNSIINEVDFTETDLSNSVFDNCDLAKTTFKNTNLEMTDFRTSFNYSIDPVVNRIKSAKFSLSGIIGLLDKYDIDIEK